MRLTKEQAAIIGLFTGVACGPFGDIHELAEKVLNRPIFTHEFADIEFHKKLKDAIRPQFLAICYYEEATR